MSIEIINAKIISASLSTADNGCLTSFMQLDYGGAQQGFGGWRLYHPKGCDIAGLWIWRVMEVVGVSEWKELPGKFCRSKCDQSKVYAIGHLLEDRWFEPTTASMKPQ